MTRPKPTEAMPAGAAAVLRSYLEGKLSPTTAARAFLDDLDRSGTSVAVELDTSLREAIVAELVARGKLPPGTTLDPDD